MALIRLAGIDIETGQPQRLTALDIIAGSVGVEGGLGAALAQFGTSTTATDVGDFSAGNGTFDLSYDASANTITFAGGSATIDASGGLSDLNLSARGFSTPLNEAGNESLMATTDFVAPSIIGAINELRAGGGGGGGGGGSQNLASVLGLGNTTGGNDLLITMGDAIDSASADPLNIGTTTASQINLGAAAIPIAAPGYMNLGTTTEAAAQGDFAAGLTGANRLLYDQSDGTLNVTYSANANTTGLVAHNTNAGTSARSLIRVRNDVSGELFLLMPSAAGYAGAQVLAGGSKRMEVGTTGAFDTRIFVANSERWRFTGTGFHFTATVDDTYDIGASGANRPRTGYFGTSLVVGDTVTINLNSVVGSGALTLTATGTNDLTLTARGSSTPFNEVGEESLTPTTDFAATSIIGAINELRVNSGGGGGGGGSTITMIETITSPAIDLDGEGVQRFEGSGAVSFTATGQSSTEAKGVTVVIDAGATDDITFTFDSDWRWVGTAPTTLESGSRGILNLISIGNGTNDIIAGYEEVGLG